MNLKWPWKEFPMNISTWGKCKKQFEKALSLLEQSLIMGTLTNAEEYKKGLFKFLDEVREPVEPNETITVEGFKNLVPNDSPDRKQVYGNFAMGGEAHKKQCENLKVGDKVFFLKIKPDVKHPDVDTNVDIVMAKVVESK